MKIVIDTNVFIAGLLKDSIVRDMLLSENIEFFLPKYAITEVEKYRKELCDKAGLTDEEFNTIFDHLLTKINLISDEEIKPYIEKATELIGNRDSKDVPFIATALAINSDGIWSFDKHFRKQKEIKIFNTAEIADFYQ